MRIENITDKQLKNLPEKELGRLRSRFINIFTRYFEGSDVQKAVDIDRRVLLTKYMTLRSEMDGRGIKFFRETPIDREIYNNPRKNPMSEIIKRLWSFIILLLKKWIIWLSLIIFVIGVFFEFVILEKTPSYIFWILAIVGFLWANFQVYKKLYIDCEELEKNHKELKINHKELEKSYEELKKNYETLEKKIPKKDRELIIKPELSIMVLEGNEYTYSLLEKSVKNRNKAGNVYIVPDASIELHFRIKNTGTINLDIISIESAYESFTELTWDFHLSTKPMEKGKAVCFPRLLESNEILLCDINNSIWPNSSLNDAQFAARLLDIDKSIRSIEAIITIEARDLTGKIQDFSLKTKVAIRPLVDFYLSKWQEEKQTNLLRLAYSDSETRKELTSIKNKKIKK